MSFAWPHVLWLLLGSLGMLVWEWQHRRRTAGGAHPRILRAEAGPSSLQLTPPSREVAPCAIRPRYWLCAGFLLGIIALARPQWGRIEEPVFDQSREILLAVDLSRSMLTPDVKPSRLDRTKLLIQSLLEKLAGERVGLVVFSGTAFLQSPLSADYEILREFLPALGSDFLPEGGTNYAAMLETALQAFGATAAADRFLIILSDGEATESDWRGRIGDLKNKAIRVLGLGVGTVGGGMIPDGAGGFVKDERGAVVLSKLESTTLQDLARATSGVYRDASVWIDLAALVNETIAAGRKGDFVEKRTVRLVERFQWPLALGVWCLLVSFYYEFPVRPKPRQIVLRPPERSPVAQATQLFLVLLPLFSLILQPAFAAAKLAQQPGVSPVEPARPAAVPAEVAAAPGESSSLSKIVGRLSNAKERSARDWVELGRETVVWGSRLQSHQQSVPEGPVRDALGAVDLGERLDAHATDWPKLRAELEALLQKKDDEQKQDDKKQSQNQDQQQDKDQQNRQDKPQQQEQQSPQQNEKSQSQPRPEDDQKKPEEKQQPGESAFGDMNQKEPPPPPKPADNMQKVGGKPERKEEESQEQANPALAQPLQKLEQLRNQDSPAQLFQLMEGDKKQPVKKSGKNW